MLNHLSPSNILLTFEEHLLEVIVFLYTREAT